VVAVARDEDRQRTRKCGLRADRRPPCYRIEGLPRSTKTGKFNSTFRHGLVRAKPFPAYFRRLAVGILSAVKLLGSQVADTFSSVEAAYKKA